MGPHPLRLGGLFPLSICMERGEILPKAGLGVRVGHTTRYPELVIPSEADRSV